MSHSEVKSRARLALHRRMSRPASFYEAADSIAPVTISARTHYAGKRVGDLAGTNLSYAEQLEHPTELIFWNADLAEVSYSLDRGSIIVFLANEGYFVDVAHPKDGQTQLVEVSVMSQTDLNGLVLPDGTIIVA